MLEEQAPYDIYPTDKHTKDRNDKRCDKGEGALCFKIRRPSYHDLDDPVDERDEEQNNLNQTALTIEPRRK